MPGSNGEEKMDIIPPSFNRWFPKLKKTGCKVTSDRTTAYNCFAWVLGLTDRKMSPEQAPFYYWPEGAIRGYSLGAFIEAYAVFGFEPCGLDSAWEEGWEKIALYGFDDEPKHAALQKSDQVWTSKIGDYEDIEHTLDGLAENSFYGTVLIILKRKKS